MQVGNKIRKLRKIKALTVSELAYLLKVDVAVVSRWENNKVVPSMNSIKKLSVALGCDLEQLTKCL